jgi:glutaredoxin
MRCEPHGLAVGADGLCVMCRREALRAGRPSTPIALWLSLAAAFGGVLAVGLAIRLRGAVLAARIERERVAAMQAREDPPAPVPAETLPPPTTKLVPRTFRQPGAAPAPPTPAPGSTSTGDMRPRDVRVVIYTTSWCPVCKRAKAWMNANSVAYEERDVEANASYGREWKQLHARGVPTIDVEGEILQGFSEDSVRGAIDRAQRRSL